MFSDPGIHLSNRQTALLMGVSILIMTTSGIVAARADNSRSLPDTFITAVADTTVPAPPLYGPANPADAYLDWHRPNEPLRVGLQAGHWQAADAPEELAGIRENGAWGGGKAEWEVNLEIARRTAAMLTAAGIVVDILPATVPPGYWADAFVSIHADDSPDRRVSGYKVASPWRDLTGSAEQLATLIYDSYGNETGMANEPNITDDMRDFYAFNWQKYQHAINPMTPAALLETGFLTNASDRRLIVLNPEIPARALADAILRFLSPIP